MKKKFIAISVVLGFVVFIGIAIVTNLFRSGDLPVQIAGALLEAVVTALITYFLLTGQTTQEEIKERQVKVFEKKQEIYHSFLQELKKIIQDGEIKIIGKDKDANLDKSIDELKDLIFQLGYLQMHTSEKTINGVLESVAKIIQLMNDFNSSSETDKQKQLPTHYSSLSEQIFLVVKILKEDLYGIESASMNKEKMVSILKELDLFVETQDFDKYEIHNYFWTEIQNQFIARNYKVDYKDFTSEVSQYYARARNRHRGLGLGFTIYTSSKTGRKVEFYIELDNYYQYGFGYEDKPVSDEIINALAKNISNSFSSNEYWAGCKKSDRYHLDFWSLNSPGFESLKNPRKREAYMKNIVVEMEYYIKEFQKLAKERDL